MREVTEQIRLYLWVVLHHRIIVLLTGIVICVAGWSYIEVIPDKYKAETKVYLDTQSMLKNLLAGLAVDNDSREQSAEVMQRTLITRPNMKKVILETDLNLTVNDPIATERLIDELIKNIKINSVSLLSKKSSNSNLYRISYTAEDPLIAKNVIEVLLNLFVENILGASRKDSHDAELFLDEQIKEYEKRQFEAEERLKLFKQKNIGVMPEEGRSHYQKIIQLDTQLETTNLAIRETDNRIVELQRQIKNVVDSASNSSPTTTSVIAPTALDIRISELEKHLDELTLQYTDNHPDVINARLSLEQLRVKKEEEVSNAPPGEAENVSSDVLNLPLYQELNVMLGEAQAEVVALKTRSAQYESQLVEKRALLKTLSEVEAELANLNRNYAINKQMYEDLVIRRESSQLSTKAEQTGDKLQFKIIEPPRIPLEPDSPNRLLLTIMVMLAGLGAGIGVAIFYEQMKPTFYTRKQLADTMDDIPVLGSVSMFWTPEEKRKRHLGIAVFGCVTLVLGVAFIGVLYHNGLDKLI